MVGVNVNAYHCRVFQYGCVAVAQMDGVGADSVVQDVGAHDDEDVRATLHFEHDVRLVSHGQPHWGGGLCD